MSSLPVLSVLPSGNINGNLPGLSSSLPMAKPGAPLDIDLFDSDAEQIAARTAILYGASGLGKSTNAKFFAQLMYELTGKPVRLVTVEDSSKRIFEPLIHAGIVQPLFFTKSKNPLVLMRRVSRGDWPLFKENGTFDRWQALKEWKDTISAYIIEGLTSGAENLLEFCREMGWFLREQKADAIEIGGEKINTSSQTSYGVVQLEMLRALKGFGMLPVERVLWTAHEAAGIEEDTKDPIRGPGLVGKAGTASVQKYCGLLLHVEGIKDGTVLKPRIFFKRHPDQKLPNISYPAKTTIPSELIPELDKEFPNGYFDPGLKYGTGLDKFLTVEEKLMKTATDELAKWKASLEFNKQKGSKN